MFDKQYISFFYHIVLFGEKMFVLFGNDRLKRCFGPILGDLFDKNLHQIDYSYTKKLKNETVFIFDSNVRYNSIQRLLVNNCNVFCYHKLSSYGLQNVHSLALEKKRCVQFLNSRRYDLHLRELHQKTKDVQFLSVNIFTQIEFLSEDVGMMFFMLNNTNPISVSAFQLEGGNISAVVDFSNGTVVNFFLSKRPCNHKVVVNTRCGETFKMHSPCHTDDFQFLDRFCFSYFKDIQIFISRVENKDSGCFHVGEISLIKKVVAAINTSLKMSGKRIYIYKNQNYE